jgi:hypothetical protein
MLFRVDFLQAQAVKDFTAFGHKVTYAAASWARMLKSEKEWG